MQIIIIAAGQGTRLRPLTDTIPKCLVPVCGKPIVDWQLESAKRLGFSKINVVCGYRHDTVQRNGIRKFINYEYKTTNMVSSLWTAETVFDDDIIVSYGDIIYEDRLLQAAADAPGTINVVIDTGWRDYWEGRFEDVFADAETLKIEEDRIIEIGQKPKDFGEIQAQYIGLMSFKGEGTRILREVRSALFKEAGIKPGYQMEHFNNMYMTDLLQEIIIRGHKITPVAVNRGWVEIDSNDDLLLAEKIMQVRDGNLVIR